MPPKKTTQNPPCYSCGEPSKTAVSNSDKNPGKPYLKCESCPSSNGQGKGLFLGWFGEYDGQPPQRKKSFAPKKTWKKKEEESEEEEEEPTPKKRKREESEEPRIPFLDKIMRDKITKNSENSEEILEELGRMNQGILKLIDAVEKLLEKENKQEV